jgi:hypothetical protein
MFDIGEDDDQFRPDLVGQQFQCLLTGGGEMHYIGALPGLPAKLLAEEVSYIRFVIHNQNTDAHDAASANVAR